jgi:hypothetical protein
MNTHRKKKQSPIHTRYEKKLLQNSELSDEIGESVTTVHKEQQFRQNNFIASDDGRVGRNIL